MSSFLPNIVVRQAIHDLNLKADLDDAAAAGEDPRRGLDRFLAKRSSTKDGRLGLVRRPMSRTPSWTAYVVAGSRTSQKPPARKSTMTPSRKAVTWLANV